MCGKKGRIKIWYFFPAQSLFVFSKSKIKILTINKYESQLTLDRIAGVERGSPFPGLGQSPLRQSPLGSNHASK